MPYNDAQKRATMKYMANNLDEVRFRTAKGKRDELRAHALEKGYNGIQPYLIDLVRRDGLELAKEGDEDK